MATSQVTEAATQQSAGIDNGQLQAAADAVVSFWDRIEKVFGFGLCASAWRLHSDCWVELPSRLAFRLSSCL